MGQPGASLTNLSAGKVMYPSSLIHQLNGEETKKKKIVKNKMKIKDCGLVATVLTTPPASMDRK